MGIDKIILKCYVELYKASTPSADFNKLIKEAKINNRGEKIIDFMSYKLDQDEFDAIIDSTIKKYRIKKSEVQKFKNTIYLGCSPAFKH